MLYAARFDAYARNASEGSGEKGGGWHWETLTYYAFPAEHWLKIRTNNMLERLNREIRRCTWVVGIFPDGESALMLVCARLRHVAGIQWGAMRYMSMKSLEQMDREQHGADCCDLA